MPVAVTFALLASACPLPVVPATYLDLVAALGGTVVAPNSPSLVTADSNLVGKADLLAAMIDSNARYGGHGVYGIRKGFALSVSSGVTLAIGQGEAQVVGACQVPVAGTTYVLPISQPSIYVWLKNNANGVATITHTLSTTPPVADCCLLGICSTNSTDILTIDQSGVVFFKGGIAWRQTADIGAPSDSPSSSLVLWTLTTTGVFAWNGTAHAPQPFAPNVQALSGTLTLNPLSSRRHALSAVSSDRTVLLPVLAALAPTDGFAFVNTGASHNIVIKDSTGVTTLCTLTPGQGISIPLLTSAGVNSWPTGSPYTGGTPTPAIPGGAL